MRRILRVRSRALPLPRLALLITALSLCGGASTRASAAPFDANGAGYAPGETVGAAAAEGFETGRVVISR